jgi:rod shape-determining protein MreC
MATFGTSGNRSLAGRGPAYGFRFFVYAVISIALMFYDQRGGWLETVRSGLSSAAYPIQLAVNSPSAAWRWTRENFAERERLQTENAALREQLRKAELTTVRVAALEQENAQLRGLTTNLPPLIEKTLPGEVVGVELSALRQRLLINRGTSNGVVKAQAVMTGQGVLGQTLRVSPWSSEIILITDAEHALPVQVQRSGLRTIAVGTGKTDALDLPYVPISSDIREGDTLVTSGLGGIFPHGIPVAKIAKVERDPAQPLATITATPLAAIANDRQVLFVWFSASHPAAPNEGGTSGNATLQPVAVPPQPADAPTPASAAASTPATAPASAPSTTPAPGTAPAASASREPAPSRRSRATAAPVAPATTPPTTSAPADPTVDAPPNDSAQPAATTPPEVPPPEVPR